MAKVDRNQPKRAASSESRMSLMEFMREFPDDATCLEHLWRARYSPDGEHALCPKCKVRVFKKYAMSNRRTSWTCTGCGHHVHPLAGTIFHKSATSLHLWFYAMYLMSSTRCGISAKQIERELGRHLQVRVADGEPDPHQLMTQTTSRWKATSRPTRPTSAASRAPTRRRPRAETPTVNVDRGVRSSAAARSGPRSSRLVEPGTFVPACSQASKPDRTSTRTAVGLPTNVGTFAHPSDATTPSWTTSAARSTPRPSKGSGR